MCSSSPITTKVCKSAQLIVSTLEASPEAAMLLTLDGNIVHQNSVARKHYLDVSSKDFVHVSSIIPTFETQHDVVTSSKGNNQSTLQNWENVVTELKSCNGTHNKTKLQKAALIRTSKSTTTTVPVMVRFVNLGGCQPGNDDGDYYISVYISERKKNDDKEEYLQVIKDSVDASFDAMFTLNEDGTIIMVNNAACALFGYSKDEFKGSNISMILVRANKKHDGADDDNHNNFAPSRYLQRTTKLQHQEVTAKKKNGTEFPVKLGIKEKQNTIHTSKRTYYAFIKDLTQEKQMVLELKHRENVAQGLINASLDPMFQINEEGIILLVNNAAVSLFGYTYNELCSGSTNISIICGKDHQASHSKYLKLYLNTGKQHIIGKARRTVKAQRKDGSEFWVELSVQEVALGEGRTFCGYIHDVTHEHSVQRKLNVTGALFSPTVSGGDETTTTTNGSSSARSTPRRPLRGRRNNHKQLCHAESMPY